ncbi:periplasmic solute binding protein [Beutenbergia cavernae DSM 12333]|uniref:Periplasmic solute binding protein n=1 Tax=Beutenbergia cavernae (strain ATCC BAA-8 / DSM 12333 / CCUG 43141 / JCM 11478 / NBRC 16432 / NCIMB 13614 / HKI 0122) TaxID=471853 RepID=C5C2G1_BEUC1|nr:metal ABC transporter substrate-binding protein [Beutenbergia cavernae]ACQ79647.1 periplasmic solute binding protein [Beutenbergia cavernae DSM 12333]
MFGGPNFRVVRAAALLLGAAAAVAGCAAFTESGGEPAGTDGERPLVLTTFSVLGDMAANVAGDHLDVASIVPVGAEIHGYEPTAQDVVRAQGADLILDNGLGLEAWFTRFTDRTGTPSVTLSEGLATVPIAGTDDVNPHAWMSPEGAVHYVHAMAEAFAELDPAHAGDYARNADGYVDRIEEIGTRADDVLAGIPPEHRLLVTCEGAFSYLARDIGLEEAYLWPVNADADPTAQHVADVTRLVIERELPAVFCESTVSDAVQSQVAAESGARLAGPLYVDSLSEADGEVPTYLDLLAHDLEVIAEGLAGGAR